VKGEISLFTILTSDFFVLRCIGATTITEFRRYVESDPALERRFERITVDEPSRDEALEILKGIRSKLEEHHHVRIADPALEGSEKGEGRRVKFHSSLFSLLTSSCRLIWWIRRRPGPGCHCSA
jgi:hypothetical protein